MEAKLADKSFNPSSKQIRSSKSKTQNHPFPFHHQYNQQPEAARSPSISRPVSSVQLEKMHGGVFLNPAAPFSLCSSLSLPPNYLYHPTIPSIHQTQKSTNSQPPLLPLPKPIFHSLPPHIRNQPLSPPPNRKQINKTKLKNPNPKQVTMSKPATKAEPPPEGDSIDVVAASKLSASAKPVESDPLKPPKEVTNRVSVGDATASFSVFSLSPPPSSLPLPRFSLRQPKFSCTVEAAAAGDQVADDGATDNLCRMLKFR